MTCFLYRQLKQLQDTSNECQSKVRENGTLYNWKMNNTKYDHKLCIVEIT